jgi:hypothetical protein
LRLFSLFDLPMADTPLAYAVTWMAIQAKGQKSKIDMSRPKAGFRRFTEAASRQTWRLPWFAGFRFGVYGAQ